MADLVDPCRVEGEEILVPDAHRDEGRVVEREREPVRVARHPYMPWDLGEHPAQPEFGVRLPLTPRISDRLRDLHAQAGGEAEAIVEEPVAARDGRAVLA